MTVAGLETGFVSDIRGELVSLEGRRHPGSLILLQHWRLVTGRGRVGRKAQLHTEDLLAVG